MNDELDLENGNASEAERLLAAGQEARRGRGRPKGSTTRASTKKKAPGFTEADDKTLKGRLVKAFSDWQAVAESREDEELADILERRKDAMAQGLVSLTRNIPVLRGPLVLLANFLEPLFAFGELGKLGITRWINRRETRLMAQQEANGVPVADVS